MILFDCSRQKNQDLLSTYLSKDTHGSSPRILGSLIYCYPVLYMFDGYLLDALKVDVKYYKKYCFIACDIAIIWQFFTTNFYWPTKVSF